MQENRVVTELLVLSGIDRDGHVAWIFAPGGWDIVALERQFPFSGSASALRRKAIVTVPVARELARRYGSQPLLKLPGEPNLDDLLSDDLAAVRLLIARDQDSTFSAMPL
ncbi:MAG: hypothetical protein QHC78_05345 [Pigmentiphaga sp.]|uniref:hypothetical protein n=1 Tax=Pigmentiphaga sp. TaxID=1977564 RepID=UPI0029B5E93E|nr:hypothetical protein [Pigmentiphaga sp.]MDX3905097.1 hypothetical protein [Pigmentiphaga sp.]